MTAPYNRYMLEQFRRLQAAFVILTRIPLASAALQDDHFKQAHGYYPLVGLTIGALCAAVFYGMTFNFAAHTSAVVAIFAGILITGAFHEDGFADACDGLVLEVYTLQL